MEVNAMEAMQAEITHLKEEIAEMKAEIAWLKNFVQQIRPQPAQAKRPPPWPPAGPLTGG